ncbi:hypothetical protein MSPP1_001981 [Malassezia sp. CBS 17886]|nr:hypothetical protein MSPP1_001981 [Malassezia sp. CBS 17886]
MEHAAGTHASGSARRAPLVAAAVRTPLCVVQCALYCSAGGERARTRRGGCRTTARTARARRPVARPPGPQPLDALAHVGDAYPGRVLVGYQASVGSHMLATPALLSSALWAATQSFFRAVRHAAPLQLMCRQNGARLNLRAESHTLPCAIPCRTSARPLVAFLMTSSPVALSLAQRPTGADVEWPVRICIHVAWQAAQGPNGAPLDSLRRALQAPRLAATLAAAHGRVLCDAFAQLSAHFGALFNHDYADVRPLFARRPDDQYLCAMAPVVDSLSTSISHMMCTLETRSVRRSSRARRSEKCATGRDGAHALWEAAATSIGRTPQDIRRCLDDADKQLVDSYRFPVRLDWSYAPVEGRAKMRRAASSAPTSDAGFATLSDPPEMLPSLEPAGSDTGESWATPESPSSPTRWRERG